MKSLVHTVYRNGAAGLSNLVMSVELGVVLSTLTGRVLVLKGNRTPVANVVQYEGVVSNRFPSRITDLIDLGVPWIDADEINLAAFAPFELCDKPAWDCVFYFPAEMSTMSDDFRSFARGRTTFITVGEELQHVPALSFSGGPDGQTLSFYSYFFYLDRTAQLQSYDALINMKPKEALADFADKVARELGTFNAVHFRRGDFKVTKGVTILDRTPAEAIEALDHHFSREDRLVVLTDEAGDPFFDDIKAAYGDHVFLDYHILANYGAEFADLPAHDSIALAYLSQLAAAHSQDFIGSMTSTFSSLIQRMRGTRGRDEPFKFLWNELPERQDEIEPGRHCINDSVPLEKGIMVEEREGPYSWNRFHERFNPAWMREWPESFLNEAAMAESARDRKVAVPRTAANVYTPSATRNTGADRLMISFLDGNVAASSNRADVTDAMRALFALMLSRSDTPASAEVRIDVSGERAELLVNGKVVAEAPTAARLLRRFYREIVCRYIERYPELIWLHAGCVASSGAVMLPGAWGRGKSSLVVELYNRGWSFLSDDIAALDPATGMVMPFPATPQIRSGAKRKLSREKLGGLPKSGLPLDPAKMADGPQPLAMVVFPHYVRGSAAKLSQLSPAQAVGQLLENCLSFANNEDETIRRLCTTVEALPVYSLRFGDVSEAARLLIDAHGPAVRSAGGMAMDDQAREVDMTPNQEVRNVDVEVTLAEGLSYRSVLPSDSPILHDLHLALAARHEPHHPATLVQLPLDGGRTACTFMSSSVVSLTTSPPVLVQPQLAADATGVAAGAPSHVRIDDFLTPDENRQLLDYALANESEFTGSSVLTRIEGYRKSRVLFSIAESKWRDVFMSRLKLHLPHIASTLNVPGFYIGKSEIQLTASNNGDFFKAHPDSGNAGDPTEGREITYVYYLHRTPTPYSGGSLLLYDGAPGHFAYDRGMSVNSIAPRNNCLIAFASNRWHEVETVHCPSERFADSRFTVNGWLRREA